MFYKWISPYIFLIDAASGGAFDWAKGKAGIKYSFAPELRPATARQGGFILPPSQIVPNGQEIWAAFVAIADSLISKDYHYWNWGCLYCVLFDCELCAQIPIRNKNSNKISLSFVFLLRIPRNGLCQNKMITKKGMVIFLAKITVICFCQNSKNMLQPVMLAATEMILTILLNYCRQKHSLRNISRGNVIPNINNNSPSIIL